jgi:zinc protease
VDRLFSGLLSARLSEIAQQPNPPFTFAFAGRGSFFARSKDSAVLNALVKEDAIERGLDTLLTEAERVARFGFTATELDRQKQRCTAKLRATGHRKGKPRVRQPGR